jgi:YVTN family beta-propeller protein
MARRFPLLVAAAVLSLADFARSVAAEAPVAERPRFKSPLGLAVDQTGQRAYVAQHTAGTVAVVDLKAGKVLREIAVGRGPFDLVMIKGTLYASCEAADTVVEADPESGLIRRCWRIGQAPRRVFVGGEGDVLGVVCRDEDSFRSVNLESAKIESVPPRLWGDGDAAWLFVAADGRPPSRKARKFLAAVSNVRDMEEAEFPEPLGKVQAYLYQLPKSSVPATQIAQGWVFANAFQLDSGSSTAPIGLLDEPQRGYADPSGVVIAPASWKIFIACAGADTVLAVDVRRFYEYISRRRVALKSLYGPDVYDNLIASRQIVAARLATQANPRRLAISGDGKTLVASNYLGDSLTVIDVERLEVVRHIPLGGSPPDAARRGEILFNSGKMTFQGQFTCASCHPNGGSDGLTWDLERDGIGNFKKTKPLLGVKDTAPYGWHGSSPTLADRVRGTLRTLHRHEPTDADLSDLVAYLKSLPPPRPLPVLKVDQPAVDRGQAIFQGKGQCASCHHRVALDDGKSHDIGTRGPTDTQDRFDTPALRGVARTAPYLHDGRAATLKEVFTKHDPKQRHGAAHTLTKDELADLIAYLKSL